MSDKKITELPVATAITAADVSVLVDNGTDYQYSFTLLLQFLQANLTSGAGISFGTFLPQNTTGADGDVFVNTAAGSFAQRTAGTWVVVYTLPAANSADGTLLYGAGLPGPATGKNADSYINTLTGIFYLKSAGAWAQVYSMATGPQGPQGIAGTNGTNGTDGNTLLFGNGNPVQQYNRQQRRLLYQHLQLHAFWPQGRRRLDNRHQHHRFRWSGRSARPRRSCGPGRCCWCSRINRACGSCRPGRRNWGNRACRIRRSGRGNRFNRGNRACRFDWSRRTCGCNRCCRACRSNRNDRPGRCDRSGRSRRGNRCAGHQRNNQTFL